MLKVELDSFSTEITSGILLQITDIWTFTCPTLFYPAYCCADSTGQLVHASYCKPIYCFP